MLSAEQQAEFHERGFTRVRGAFSPDAASAMEERLWEALETRFGVRRDDPSTWRIAFATGLRNLRTQSVFRAIGGETTVAAIDDLLGEGQWTRPKHWGQLLVTFPTSEPVSWTVPARLWHTDFPYTLPSDRVCGVLMVSFISRVPAGHGGTAVVDGSPRVVERTLDDRPQLKRVRMKMARKALLGSDPWLRSLLDKSLPPRERVERFMQRDGLVGDLPVRVAELTGEPGDVVLGHPWLLHAPAPNCGEHPRFMSVQRIRLGP